MTCLYCGNAYCTGSCLSVAQQGTLYQGAPIVLQGQQGYPYGPTAAQPSLIWNHQLQSVIMDYSVTEFLETIADKNDSDSCISFMERQQKRNQKLAHDIEMLKKACQDDLDNAEKEFLAKCQKYRPSITPDLLTRVKGLKAFY